MVDGVLMGAQEQLDHMLQKRQARETGICPVRRELYSQCFGAPIDCLCA
jgi:dynein light intermediate chain